MVRRIMLVGGGWIKLTRLEGEVGWRLELSIPYESSEARYPSKPLVGMAFDTNGRIKNDGK